MKNYDSYDPEVDKKYKMKAYKQFMTYAYMEGADKTKYGSLLSGLHTHYSLGNNQYPNTITDANSVLSNLKFDTTSKSKSPTIKNGNNSGNTAEENPELGFSQIVGRCHCCGKPGHKSPKCWNNKPRHEWAIHKFKNQSILGNNSSNESQSNTNRTTSTQSVTTTATSNVMSEWCGTNVQFYQALDMKSIILLDNQSTVSLFCNRNFVERVWRVKDQLELATNGGKLYTNLKASV
jgi:hypothetical protein